ncbi:MAG: CidA/LrgA family protein [Rhizobacter sp.]|nr:CidA/LrgA family protein [Rhizobacter sp.]HOX67181.1 CidA/LrgA family protein [Burkholderiaceae bacterium]
MTSTAAPLQGLAWLLACQSAGELLARAAPIGLPGPVIGMLILMLALGWEPVRGPVGAIADVLLAHLSLLFVPVGVGVMTHMALVSQYGARLAVALLLSTWIGLAVTALVLRALLPKATSTGLPKPDPAAPR